MIFSRHQSLVTIEGHHSGVVFLGFSSFGVEHVGPFKKVCVGGTRLQSGDGDVMILEFKR